MPVARVPVQIIATRALGAVSTVGALAVSVPPCAFKKFEAAAAFPVVGVDIAKLLVTKFVSALYIYVMDTPGVVVCVYMFVFVYMCASGRAGDQVQVQVNSQVHVS